MLLILRKTLGLLSVFAVFAALSIMAISPLPTVRAQGGNLLQDPSFETTETYKRVAEDTDSTTFDVPPAWNGWLIKNAPGDETWKNRVPTGFPHTGLFKIDQARSLHISRGFATFTTAVFQTVSVPQGANVQGSARGFMERGAGGSPDAGGSFRVGIDPNGGSNPLDPAIVWSNTVSSDDAWVQASTSATASGTSVTLFLYATQTSPTDPNGIYWDDAKLSVGGEGGAAPGVTPGQTSVIVPTPNVPTPPPFAPYVAPQAPQADGSIVHTVAAGDTFASIAVAYGVTFDELLELNNMETAPRFLQIGQKLTVRRAAPSGSSSEDIANAGNEDDEDATEDVDATDEVTDNEERDATEEADEEEAEASPTRRATESDEEDEASETEEATEESEETAEVIVIEPTDIPATPTDGPAAPVTQVAQANANVTGVCVTLFEDVNQNRIREDGEGLLAGGTITLSGDGETVGEYETDGASEPHCFEELAVGLYTAAAQAPEGYGLTTAAQFRVNVQSGQRVNAVFGAAQGVEVASVPTANSADDTAENPDTQALVQQNADDPNNNALMQNLGLIVMGAAGFVLIFGIGIALVLRRR
jgi:LysM repeat protein